MKKTLLVRYIGFLSFAFGSCTEGSVKVEYRAGATISTTIKKSIEDVASDYHRLFKYPTYITVSDTSIAKTSKTDTSTSKEVIQYNDVVFAMGLSHRIILNDFFAQAKEFNSLQARNVIAHELFHSIRDSIGRMFSFGDSGAILFKGVGYAIFDKEANIIAASSVVEEAAAEVCALYLYEDYHGTNSYDLITKLLMEFIQRDFISVDDLVFVQTTSNLDFLIGKILNKDAVGVEDVSEVFMRFTELSEVVNPQDYDSAYKNVLSWFVANRNY